MSIYLQEIRRHLMIKRPQFLDNEEKLADAEETRSPHKTHHHPSKGHASRHHKKHDKITHTTADFIMNTTTESVTKINTTPRDEKESITEENLDKYNAPIETSTTETVGETSTTTTLTTVKPKKLPRRQKTKETSTNRTEIEEDRPQRRRKTHQHRRNNTLLTNSVHDDVPRVNTTYITSDVTLSTQNPTTRERYNYNDKFTTVSTPTEQNSMRQETQYSDVFRSTNNFNEDRTTESFVVTESGMTSTYTTEMPRTSPAIEKSFDQPRNMSTTIPTTVPSVKRYPKVQKNRTSGILGPARIDVTILESPDRKHKQGIVINFN